MIMSVCLRERETGPGQVLDDLWFKSKSIFMYVYIYIYVRV